MSLPSTTSPPKATANSTQSDIGFLQHELTPESKIKALLAKIDEDTDSDGGRLSQDFLKGEKVQHPERNVSSPISVVDRQYRRNSNETDDDGSDEAPIVPRGRLAARLHGRNVTIGSLPNSRIGESPGNTYEKLKNQPLQNTDQEDLIMEEPMADLSDVENIVHSQLPRSRKNLSESPRNSALFEESDSDLPAEPQINKRLQTLLTRKKEELKAKEATELKRKAERRAQDGVEATNLDAKRSRRDSFSSSSSRDDSDDRAADKKLTQQSRPTRKASKRALEEMSRETQRMSRNMQLAHQAKTKKKITKESFLGRFNLGATKLEDTSLPSNPSSSTIRSSEAPSDVDMQGNDSPPTSPAPSNDTIHKFHEPDEPEIALEDVQRVLPSGLFLLSKSPRELAELSAEPAESNNETSGIKLTHHSRAKSSNPSVIARLSKTALRPDPIDFDSGSDLEIVPDRRHKESKLGVFDRLPTNKAQEKRSLQTLRVLACMNSPGQKTTSSRPSMTMFDMQKSLQMRARKQAAAERAEKIQDLKDRGVIIQTAEERQKDQAEVEDLVDKARKEAMAIMQKEKQIAKSKKILHHEKDITDGSSDEDEDYQANDADQSDLELSGSEEEDSSEKEHVDDGSESESESELMDDEADGGVEILTKRPDLDNLIEAEASEDGNEAASHQDEDNSHDECLEITNSRKSRVQRIVLDEDTSEDEEALVLQSPAPVTNAIQSPPIAGIPFANIIPMGMTQAFAATIAETQTQEASRADREQDSLDLMGSVPEPDFPLHDLDAREVVLDSQMDREQDDVDKNGNDTTMEIDIHLPQSPTMGNVLNGLQELPPTLTQFSEIPDPTQDVGFALNSPVPNRFVSVPPSTVDTVLLSRNPNTPTVKRKSRLRRGTELSNAIIDIKEDSQPVSGTTGSAITADAFDVLKKAAREKTRPTEVFDKKKSEAKEMVEEQAQESEDEYAGLGGASDDESAGEEDEEVRKMIDEEDVDVDERKLAAFHANKERESDEKAVEKLFKDLNNGGLRRKRGADFELSDSDDDIAARQRAKRREFAKMRKALLANENVGKIAEDPKKLAFLRAIEDRDDNEYLDFVDEGENGPLPPSTTESQEPTDPLPKAKGKGKGKRPLQESIPDNANRAPSSRRRTHPQKKPCTLAEIRASVSFLLEEPHAPPPPQHPSSSPPTSDTEPSFPPPPPPSSRRATTIIDRISLKRAESASASLSSDRLAFHNPSAMTSAFKPSPPSLLRRATTSQVAGADKHGISYGAGGSAGVAGTERAAGGPKEVKTGGSRRSNLGYFARERVTGGKAVLREAERRRQEGLRRLGSERSGLGELVAGSFE